MTYQRQMLAVVAGFFLAAGWASGSSAHPASHVAQHPVAIDSTDYQSQGQLLANTQVMVVARVESVGRDRSAPASQPAVLVTLQVHDRHPRASRRAGRCRAASRRQFCNGSGGADDRCEVGGHTCSCWPGSWVADPSS